MIKVLYDVNSGRLTPRAIEVLILLMDGCTNEQICKNLFISTNTVKFYLANLMNIFEVSNRTELVAIVSKYFPKDAEKDEKYRTLLNM